MNELWANFYWQVINSCQNLKQPGFTCGPFTSNKEGIEKFMQTGNTDFIYRNELDKICFQHDMVNQKT